MRFRTISAALLVVSVGLGWSVLLHGAPPQSGSPGRTRDDHSKPQVVRPPAEGRIDQEAAPAAIHAGRVFNPNSLPISEPVIVDYLDDEGTRGRQMGLFNGPMPKPTDADQGVVANIPPPRKCTGGTHNGLACTSDADCPGLPDGACNAGTCTGGLTPGVSCGSDEHCFGSRCGCNFAIECDDGMPCTMDRCALKAGNPAQTGKCIHDPVPDGQNFSFTSSCRLGALCGGCDDGLACNGLETCQGGACAAGMPLNCGGGKVCNENGRCLGGPYANQYCLADLECYNGACNHCQTVCASDTDCSDGLTCNGTETCVGGLCMLGAPPCGPGGLCGEKKCSTITGNPWSCAEESDCTGGGTCTVAGPACQPGRCCDTASPQPNCTRRGFIALPAITACTGKWFAGDGGTTSIGRTTNTTCPSGNTGDLPAGLPGLRCPKYGDGIAPQKFGPLVGPISDGPMPNPQFGGPLHKLGDDYQFTDSSNILVDEMHWIGGRLVDNRVSIEFYDEFGNFIEDTFINYADDGITVKTALFQPAIELPPKGFVVLTVASSFSPNARYFWATTDSASVDVGSNDPNVIWINDGPVANVLAAPNQNLAFELVGRKTMASSGACCLTIPGPMSVCNDSVTPWGCEGQGGVYLGNNRQCASCDSGTHGGEQCRRCDSASGNAGASCDRDADCTGGLCVASDSVCQADGNPNAHCVSVSSCGAGACCNPTTGGCTVVGAATCNSGGGNFQGYGTSCDVDNGYDSAQQSCCPQPTHSGADNCEDVVIRTIALPAPGADPVTVTISGDNSSATGNESDAQCFYCGPGCDPEGELGWWEGFDLDGCAYVRIDTCCTGTDHNVLRPAWAFIFPDCPCGRRIQTSANPHVQIFNGYSEPASNRGLPYCQDDNIWMWFGPLTAGRYYYPVYSALLGYHGPYHLHITAMACPLAACCKGSTCVVRNEIDCEVEGGWYLGPPNHIPATSTCFAQTCSTGACCTAPGVCVDRDLDPPVTQAECETPGDISPNGGTYIGGAKCKGGSCSANTDFSCSGDGDCAIANGGPGGTCLGDPRNFAQPDPCPVCPIQTANSCQAWENAGRIGGLSDPSIGSSGIVAADDFVPLTSTISHVCVWGSYVNTAPGAALECGPSVTEDHFRVRIWEDFEGLPCNLVGESMATTTRADHEGIPETPPPKHYGFSLTLNVPITGLDGSGHTNYWLEVSNSPSSLHPMCAWFWEKLSPNSPSGNQYSAAGSDAGGYPAGSERSDDYAWCLSGDVVPGIATPVRVCCNCNAGTCSLLTLRDCNEVNGIWDVDSGVCGPCAQSGPPNDHCTSTIGNLVGLGTYSFDTQCADTDGPTTSTPGETGNAVRLEPDAWYRFQAPVDCTLTVSMCGTGTAYDSMLAVYHKPGDCDFCPTNANSGNTFLVNGRYEDESCTGIAVGGAGYVSPFQAHASECYVIRVGGYNGERGSGVVDISCVPTQAARSDSVTRTQLGDCQQPPPPPPPRCSGLPYPQPMPDPAGIDKVRYISFGIPSDPSAASSAIEVKLVSLMHPDPPNLPQFLAPNFTAFEGESRWIGPPGDCVESELPAQTFKCARLQCMPYYTDWNAAVGGQTLQVTGAEIVPSSQYRVRAYATSCQGNEATCTNVSSFFCIITQRWGDLVPPFQVSGNAPLTQPNIGDVAALVDKFKGRVTAPVVSRTDLTPNVPDGRVDITDVAADVDAFKGLAYPYPGPATCP